MSGTIACIGECMVELAPNGSGDYRRGFAGDCFNTAWTLTGLLDARHSPVRFVTAIGDDRLSRDLLEFMEKSGLDTGSVAVLSGQTIGLYMISLDGAERSFTYWRSMSAARRMTDDARFLGPALQSVTYAYYSGITLAILPADGRHRLFSQLRAARERGARVLFDPNIRMRLWPDADTARDVIAAGYRLADIALPSFSDEADLFGDRTPLETVDRLIAAGVTEIVVKDGASPCLVHFEGTTTSVPAVESRALDTTGAGDSFNAGYIAARHCGRSPVEAARFGHEIASRVIGVRGALIDRQLLADQKKLLESRN